MMRAALSTPGAATRSGARGTHVSVLLSVMVHTALLLSVGWLSVRAVRPEKPVIRVSILSPSTVPGPDGGQPPAAPAPAPAPPAPLVLPAPPPKVKPKAQPPKPAAVPRAKSEMAIASKARPEPTPSGAEGSGESTQTGAATGSGDAAGGRGSGGSGAGNGTGPGGGGGLLAAYLSDIRQRIERAKRYPPIARRSGVQGRVAVAFELTSLGQTQAPTVVHADHPLLGEAALSAVRSAAPFPAFPAGVQSASMHIEVPLRFTLEDQ